MFSLVLAGAAVWCGQIGPASAQVSQPDQQELFEQMVRQPTNYEATFAFVRTATANGDYEAAIGALERLLFYNPDLPAVKYELGSLYYRLGSYDLATRYFNEALASPNLDSATKDKIEAYLADSEKQSKRSRLSGLLQAGIRYQSNANYGPSDGIVRIGGQDLSLQSASKHQPDGNSYEILGLSHDYDFDDARGDTLETRLAAYSSQQFRFSAFDVDLFDLSVGPRIPISLASLPGTTLKPYVAGGSTWVGGNRYASSAGAGLEAGIPLNARLSVQPSFEWRHVDYRSNDATPTANFATGNAFSGGLISTLRLADDLALEMRAFYRRGTADASFQSYDQWEGAAALTVSFAPLIESSPSNWTVAPYARYTRTQFDAANPFIDANTVQTDDEWTGGVVLNAPLNRFFGLSASVQYDYTASNLPNYREKVFSVMTGPTLRF